MKTKLFFAAAALALCLGACEKKQAQPQVSNIEISEMKGMAVADSLPESIEFALQSGVLHVAHNNVYANCGAPQYLQVSCTIKNDSLIIVEDSGIWANCNSIFDWSYCISPIKAGNWNIILKNDLKNDTTFTVTISETKWEIAL